MGRRKRVLDDGDDSDLSNASDGPDLGDFNTNDPDAREEQALFEDPYQRKRRRKNRKEDAIYGVFGEDSEDEGFGRKPVERKKRSDWAKAPAFVSSDKKVDQTMDVDFDSPADEEMEDAGSSDESSEGEDDNEAPERGGDSDASEPSRPTSTARVEEEPEEEDERPRFGGIGSFKRTGFGEETSNHAGLGATKGGIGSPRGGIGSARGLGTHAAFMSASTAASAASGFGRGGIGSKSRQPEIKEASPSPGPSSSTQGFPSAFGGRQQNRFIREETPAVTPIQLSADERAHFSKLKGSFGARLLEKMGWEAGKGLGATGEGIVTPIESKLRPQKMGIAFKGFKEKTEQSKREAKRRGEDGGDEEEDPLTKKMKKKAKEAEKKRSDVWKKPKKVKTKVEHKSYEQILAEAGESTAPVGLGQIIDATGAVPKEVSSLAEISLNTWTPTSDPTRIPEVRHNVRLIADACKSDLDGLAREAKALQERKQFVIQEDARLRKQVEEEAELISRLQQIQLVANEIQSISKELASVYEVSLDPLSPHIKRLVNQFPNEFDNYQLDEIVVASIAPLLRRMVANWNPLEDPTAFLSTFREWRGALKVNTETAPSTQVDIYGARTTVVPLSEDKTMTPFESLLWNVWLPKVRTVVNNEWSAEDASPAVKLYESWSSFLPRFIRDNMLDQLFLPKVQKAVADWNPKRSSVSLQSIVFPWLPHIGLRLDTILDDARRKVKSLLKSWVIGEGKPDDLRAWKDVFGKGEWDTLMLKYIVPKIGETLRTEFRIYPPAQKMEPFQSVVAWSDLLRPSIFSQILETEFFPKWLDVLHLWLIQPNVSFEEVAQWYQFWKDAFPESVRNLPNIERGFRYGLQLMNDAITLGPEALAKLKKPDFRGELATKHSPSRTPSAKEAAQADKRAARPSARATEITFRAIVEEYAAGHDLLFIPTGRAHEKSRMPLFRVSATVDGKHGLLVYILDDAVWAPQPGGLENDDFRAISLEDMVARAIS